MLTNEEIKYFKENQNKITSDLLKTLREKGNKGKEQVLEILDMPKSPDNYHLDAFNNPITFNGDRTLKKPYTSLKLSDIHIQEIEKCMESPLYFIDNYVKIMTKSGVDFVENRDYQVKFIETLTNKENEAILGLMPRQCIEGETKLTINNKEISIKDFFEECKSDKKID